MDNEFSFPSLFILDKEDIIQYYTVKNFLCGRSINKLLRTLQSIQYVKENPGQVFPVDWKLNEQSLKSNPLKSKQYFKTFYSQKTN
uniref:Uncharacterized protein n=1 Tax=Plagiogramma staurophorum TaxID=1003089 RepID=A0A2U9NMH8_9STRA|nr:hypothetical protein ycf42 [Plagiogramma staurophorum]YP_009495920.1 hypothetical protein ycf42 [Plagiogramma staurophorum]AWT38298.1 hypothetical protein ycf42 [Plagiogramma staurophorum]AWT38359.1 hypothetical protein ycf42 [Plagiogramma staurophorum]